MRVLWIDPGETVGWAASEYTQRRIKVYDYGNDKMRTFALRLLDEAGEFDVVGFETYTIRPDAWDVHVGGDCPTLQLIGMIRLACWLAQVRRQGRPEIAEQTTQAKRKGLGYIRLKAPDMLPIVEEALAGDHDDGHFGDAIMHTFAWWAGRQQ